MMLFYHLQMTSKTSTMTPHSTDLLSFSACEERPTRWQRSSFIPASEFCLTRVLQSVRPDQMKKDIIRLHQSSVEHSIRNKTNPGRFSSAECPCSRLQVISTSTCRRTHLDDTVERNLYDATGTFWRSSRSLRCTNRRLRRGYRRKRFAEGRGGRKAGLPSFKSA